MFRFSADLVAASAGALVKISTELTEQGRAQVKDKNFVFPEEKKYPIHDKPHAESALGFSKMHGSPDVQAKVRAAVEKKYPGLNLEKNSAAPKKEKRRPWNVSNVRSGKRPMSVDTMLRKEKDGSLGVKLGQALVKIAQFYGPILPFSDVTDKGAAILAKKNLDHIPSREQVEDQTPKREDGRSFTTTDIAPGTTMSDVGVVNSPQERTASAKTAGSLGNYLASARGEHHGDLAGLALMAASSGDKLRSQLAHPNDDQKGSLMGGDTGRVGADLAGLALMTAPTVASLAKGTGSRFTNAMNLAGLGALTVPTLDKLQANLRARRDGSDPEKKMLMGHTAHALSELGGYGLLAAPVVRNAATGHAPVGSALMTLGGYGALATPAVEDLVEHDERKRVFTGANRSAAELGGLGLLAAGAMHGH